MTSQEPQAEDVTQQPLDPTMFRDAMARFPTGVTIVTARDEDGRPHGFTANSFCSVSLDPPLVLVCLAKAANSYPVFARMDSFAVSVLQAHHFDLAHRFATRNTDKFGQERFVHTARGRTVLAGASAVIECTVDSRHKVGDHMIMLGRVDAVLLGDKGAPAVYFDRNFSTVCRASCG